MSAGKAGVAFDDLLGNPEMYCAAIILSRSLGPRAAPFQRSLDVALVQNGAGRRLVMGSRSSGVTTNWTSRGALEHDVTEKVS